MQSKRVFDPVHFVRWKPISADYTVVLEHLKKSISLQITDVTDYTELQSIIKNSKNMIVLSAAFSTADIRSRVGAFLTIQQELKSLPMLMVIPPSLAKAALPLTQLGVQLIQESSLSPLAIMNWIEKQAPVSEQLQESPLAEDPLVEQMMLNVNMGIMGRISPLELSDPSLLSLRKPGHPSPCACPGESTEKWDFLTYLDEGDKLFSRAPSEKTPSLSVIRSLGAPRWQESQWVYQGSPSVSFDPLSKDLPLLLERYLAGRNSWSDLLSKKVLILEDMSSVRTLLKRRLSALGFKTFVEVSDGRKAWEILQPSKDFGLILCDWDFSEATRVDFISRVRKDSALTFIPIVLMCVKGDEKTIADSLKEVDRIHWLSKAHLDEQFETILRTSVMPS